MHTVEVSERIPLLSTTLAGYRDPGLAKKLRLEIENLASGLEHPILIMHVCGTHEWTITHYGIRSLLPQNVEVRAGPGCPVCVTPAADIDAAVALARDGVTLLTYGDMSRARGTTISLADAKALGADVRVVYSVHDAVEWARRSPDRKFVFFAVGFETTAPPTAYEIMSKPPENLNFLVSYRYVPPAVGALARSPDLQVDGFINAGHASTVSGMKAYKPYFDETQKPMVFCGFEPVDVLISVAMLLKQIRNKEPKMENEYTRAVTWDGNVKAQEVMDRVFELGDGYWRGVATLPGTGFRMRREFEASDARRRYGIKETPGSEQFIPRARCADVIMGKIDPPECPLYMKECTPDSPKGPTMVSIEGTCKIWADHKVLASMKCRI
jgi:hydrogenase expression/formation protein HypD